MARKYTKVEQLTEIVKERHDQGETYGEIATTLISTISSVFHLKTVSLRLKFEARPHNPMKFYDSPLFSCLLLGEQSNSETTPFLHAILSIVGQVRQYTPS